MSKRKIVVTTFIFMALLSLLIFNQVMFADTLPTTGLVAYYPFNGNANDESGNGNNGTVYGATLTTDRFGNANSAYSFDGINDYIRVPNKNILNFGVGDFSISVYINIRNVVYDPQFPGASIINKRWTPEYYTTGWNQWDLVYSFNNNTLVFWTYSYDYSEISSGNNIRYNKYYHLVAIRNREKMSIYLNGVLVSQSTYIIRDLSNPMDIFIGVDGRHLLVNYNDKYYFDGVIDDIRLYNRALSASEVQTLYHEGGWPNLNLLQNPSFNNGVEGWYCVNNTTTTAKTNVDWNTTDYATAPGSLKVQCYNNGDSYKDIQLLTNRFNLIKDRTYLLTFKAKSSDGFTIPSIKLNQAISPWTDYAAPYTGLPISTGWRDYAVIYTANATVIDARVTFFLGGALPNGATLNLDDVSLKEFVANPPATGEMLANPGFDLGNSDWNFYCDSTAQANGYLDSTVVDTAPVSYRIDCTQSGSSVNAIQLFTMPFNLAPNQKYQLTFRAKCSSPFTIPSIRLMKATSPWTIYAWPLGTVSVTTDWQTYTVNFTAYSTASDGRMTFFLGNALPPGAVFWIDSLSFREVGQ